MPKAKRKSREKKRWYTYAYMTWEGAPAPGHFNFTTHQSRSAPISSNVPKLSSRR